MRSRHPGNPGEDIACWFIDTDYDEENFFVRHAYFLGAHDPYKGLKTTLKAEIDEEAWASLYRDVSRLFPRPATGRFAVKVINHVGDEVIKVFQVQRPSHLPGPVRRGRGTLQLAGCDLRLGGRL